MKVCAKTSVGFATAFLAQGNFRFGRLRCADTNGMSYQLLYISASVFHHVFMFDFWIAIANNCMSKLEPRISLIICRWKQNMNYVSWHLRHICSSAMAVGGWVQGFHQLTTNPSLGLKKKFFDCSKFELLHFLIWLFFNVSQLNWETIKADSRFYF